MHGIAYSMDPPIIMAVTSYGWCFKEAHPFLYGTNTSENTKTILILKRLNQIIRLDSERISNTNPQNFGRVETCNCYVMVIIVVKPTI